MFKNTVKSLSAITAVILFSISSPVMADDTEIYVANPEDPVTAPMVMFNIEYTSNLTSTICTGLTDTMDEAAFNSACPEMDGMYMYLADNDPDDGIIDDLVDGTIDQFEMTRAALKRVLTPLGKFKVGVLMPHDDDNGCAGPAETGCSGGGYIFQKMTYLKKVTAVDAALLADFSTATQTDYDAILADDIAKQKLFDKLDQLQSPQGNFSHKNQLKEIYFELFRYLTGQAIYNGHNGWNDFGTDSNYNLGGLATPPPTSKNDFNCTSGVCDPITPTPGDEYTYDPGNAAYMGDFVQLPNGNYANTLDFQWDTNAESGSNYMSPLEDCARVYVINVLDGGGTSQNDADSDIALSLANGGMNFSPSNNDPGFVQMAGWLHDKDLADGTITGYLEQTSQTEVLQLQDIQNVTSFFIANQPQQLDAAASAGGTGTAIALTDNPQDVVDTINDLFQDILSISTTFVSASIPVNVFNRSEVLDNAYVALFQADEGGQPYWVGNVKKLKLEIYTIDNTNYLRLIDANAQPAIAPTDGRIVSTALTFWTDANGYDIDDQYETHENANPGFDGRIVYRGGAGQQVPEFLDPSDSSLAGNVNLINSTNSTDRTVYTESSGSLVDLEYSQSLMNELWPYMFDKSDSYLSSQWDSAVDYASMNGSYSTNDFSLRYSSGACSEGTFFFGGYLSTSDLTALGLDCTIQYKAANLIAYIRGKDIFDEDQDGVYDVSRRWLFGDPLHARPIPINYGAHTTTNGEVFTESNPDVRLLVGGNDGFMRMIKNTNAGGTESGKEVWAFMPKEALGIQKQLMENADNSYPDHPYGVDGAPTAYILDGDGTITTSEATSGTDDDGDGVVDKVWLFFGMRRGGEHYYAMDITDPDNPTFKWKKGPQDSGFAEMSMTFSQPVVRHIDWGNGSKPVVIVGAGYDPAKDNEYPGDYDDIGNAIYVINADDGSLIWKASGSSRASASPTLPFVSINSEMDDSIPSQVTAVDATGDGLVDTVYVGDTGGRVWRADLYGNDPTAWAATKLMDLGRHASASADVTVDDRRFFNPPDIVPARDGTGSYYAVVIGSGNRAHPKQQISTVDGLFLYKDRQTGSALGSFTAKTEDDLYDVTYNCDQQVAADQDASCSTVDSSKLTDGWKLYFLTQGEKNLATPLTLRGVIYFSTYVPITSSSSTSCDLEEGRGYQYAIALSDATAVINYDTSNTATDADGTAQELQIDDRKRELLSGGIPSENVYVSYRDSAGNEYAGVLSSDLQAGQDLGKLQWRTYWLEKQK